VLPAGSAGTNVPFELQLPRSLTPSFETVSHKLAWWLVATSGSFFGTKVNVSLPLEIVDASAAATTTILAAAPRLGDERVATLFARFAASAGWRGGAIDDDGEDARLAGQFSIERDVDDSELRIAYAYRGEEGTFVVSRISHPPLGLDLAVTPSSSLRHVFFKDVEVDIAVWDRAHHVNARAADQAIPPLRAIVPTLMRSGRLGSLVRWDDDAIVFERPIAGLEEPDLAVLSHELIQLATVITGARHTIAPPAGIAVDLDAWQRLAKWLDGRFTVGDLSIDGTLDHAPVTAALEWIDGQPKCVRATLGDPEAASAELRAIAISLAHPASDVLHAEPAIERLVERVSAWPPELVELRVTDGVASAAYVIPAGDPPVVETSRVRELIEALRGVLVALDPGAGPYR
jgi:hypothetical protein